jgi:hypothetical protein
MPESGAKANKGVSFRTVQCYQQAKAFGRLAGVGALADALVEASLENGGTWRDWGQTGDTIGNSRPMRIQFEAKVNSF